MTPNYKTIWSNDRRDMVNEVAIFRRTQAIASNSSTKPHDIVLKRPGNDR
jgi:hypothetical protein